MIPRKFGAVPIPVGVVGRVLNSDHSGHMVRVDDDSANTGGFLLFERWDGSDGPNHGQCFGGWFDNWVANESELEDFFINADWQIHWGEQT